MSYSEYIVTFLDALGTKERSGSFIESSKITDALNQSCELIKECMPLGYDKHLPNYEQKAIRFSDTLVIFSTLPNQQTSVQKAYFSSIENYHASLFAMNLWNISLIQHILFMQGILTRGAITRGEAFCDNMADSYFGPAFIRSYELESSYSIYPRVIIDPQIVSNSNFFSILASETERFNKLLAKLGTHPLFYKKDFDGMYYINYFPALKNIRSHKSSSLIPHESVYANTTKKMREQFKKKYSDFTEHKDLTMKNISIQQKYSWVTRQLEENDI